MELLISGALLLVLLWGGFRVGRWFGTSYDTNLGHYVVAVVMVTGAVYIFITDSVTVRVQFVAAFAGFYVGLFIGGHQRLWSEEERRIADATAAPAGPAAAAGRCAACDGEQHGTTRCPECGHPFCPECTVKHTAWAARHQPCLSPIDTRTFTPDEIEEGVFLRS